MSGLAAAVALVRRGIRPLLLEQKPVAGGRSSSFRDQTTGEIIDNGQHVLLAGYHRTMDFLREIGSGGLIRTQARPRLFFHHPVKGFCRFSVPRLPSPLHFGLAIAASPLFRPLDRLRMLRAGLMLARPIRPDENHTISEWLDLTKQAPEARRSFWEPLAVSIMNELPQAAAAAPFVRSLREAFLGSWHNACLVLPSVPLADLYVHRAISYIEARGGEVRCAHDVRALAGGDRGVNGVTLRDGTTIRARAVILAVPPYRLGDLGAGKIGGVPVHLFGQFGHSPIVSTHLWFGTEFMPWDFLGLIGRRTQWIFNRRRIESSNLAGSHISTVTSAAYDLVERPNDEIIRNVLDELRTVVGSRAGEPFHAVVVKEKRATVSLTPAAERIRPPQTTAVPNLFLAGDWTKTGLPATIEGAIISGERAAAGAAGFLSNDPPLH